jgi:hypothetical protein
VVSNCQDMFGGLAIVNTMHLICKQSANARGVFLARKQLESTRKCVELRSYASVDTQDVGRFNK